MRDRMLTILFFFPCMLLLSFLAGCAGQQSGYDLPLRHVSEAQPGDEQQTGDGGMTLDVSNVGNGYVLARFDGVNDLQARLMMVLNGTEHWFAIHPGKGWETIPLTSSGEVYLEGLVETAAGSELYVTDVSITLKVQLLDPLEPFLRSSQVVNYDDKPEVMSLHESLSADMSAAGAQERLFAILQWEMSYMNYDYGMALSPPDGHVPDLEHTIQTRYGVCYDLASLMCALLRMQGIPSRLEIGYMDEGYHAWVSTYSYVDETWKRVEWKAGEWYAMDPTLAITSGEGIKDYIDAIQCMKGVRYVVRYTY